MKTGQVGEALVAEWYIKEGFEILAQNYRIREGELDIVAQKGDIIAFVEVKTRTTKTGGLPCEAVTLPKQRRLILAASHFLQEKEFEESFARFDVAEVFLPFGSPPQINVLVNAFTL